MKTISNGARKSNQNTKNLFDDFFTIEFIDVVETKWQFVKNQAMVSNQGSMNLQKARLSLITNSLFDHLTPPKLLLLLTNIRPILFQDLPNMYMHYLLSTIKMNYFY